MGQGLCFDVDILRAVCVLYCAAINIGMITLSIYQPLSAIEKPYFTIPVIADRKWCFG